MRTTSLGVFALLAICSGAAYGIPALGNGSGTELFVTGSAGFQYDDNIFLNNKSPKDDFITTLDARDRSAVQHRIGDEGGVHLRRGLCLLLETFESGFEPGQHQPCQQLRRRKVSSRRSSMPPCPVVENSATIVSANSLGDSSMSRTPMSASRIRSPKRLRWPSGANIPDEVPTGRLYERRRHHGTCLLLL